MADDTETPATPKPRARRAPRKTVPVTSKPSVTASAKPAASKPRRKPTSTATAAAAASAPTTTATTTPTKKPAAPPKPRSSKRATPAPKRPTKPTSPSTSADADKKGGWKNKAVIAGGLAAVGAAATAALLSLRGSTPKRDFDGLRTPVAPKPSAAHTADGTDASASFSAGIADEGVIPE